MKATLVFLIALPLTVIGQDYTVTFQEPVALYREINSSLAQGKSKEAIELFDKVVEFYTDRNQQNELPQNYFGMALALALNGNYKESIHYHKKAIKAHKQFRKDEPIEIYTNLGLTYQLAGKERMAEKILGGR